MPAPSTASLAVPLLRTTTLRSVNWPSLWMPPPLLLPSPRLLCTTTSVSVTRAAEATRTPAPSLLRPPWIVRPPRLIVPLRRSSTRSSPLPARTVRPVPRPTIVKSPVTFQPLKSSSSPSGWRNVPSTAKTMVSAPLDRLAWSSAHVKVPVALLASVRVTV